MIAGPQSLRRFLRPLHWRRLVARVGLVLACLSVAPTLHESVPTLHAGNREIGDFVANRPEAGGCSPDAIRHDVRVLRDALSTGNAMDILQRGRQLLGTVERACGPFTLEAAEVLDLIVECAGRAGRATDAETQVLVERALRIHLVFSDDVRLAESLRSTGLHDELCNRLPEASELYALAARILAAKLGPTSLRVAMLGNDLAIVATRRGRYTEAIAAYRTALAALEAGPASDPLDIAFVLNGLAIASFEAGEYSDAREAHERAVKLRARHLPPDHPKVAESLNNLGALLARMGDDSRALELFERVLAIRRQTYGERSALTAAAMVNVARLLLQQGNHASAQSLYTTALEIFENQSRDPGIVACYLGLGILHQETGSLAQAQIQYEKVLAVKDELLGPEHPYVGEALHRFAALHYAAGDLDAARKRCAVALAIRRASLGSQHPEVAESMVLLATVEAASGNANAAFRMAADAEAMALQHQQFASRTLTEREALLLASVRARGLDLMQDLADRGLVESPGIARRVWEAVIRSRAQVLDEMMQRSHAAALGDDPELARLMGDLQEASVRFANLALRSASAERVQEAERAKVMAERALAEKSLVYREWRTRSTLGLDAVARSLPPGDALVAFSVYRRPGRPGSEDASDRALAAFVLAGTNEPRRIALGPMQHIDSLVVRWGVEAAVGVGARGRSAVQSEAAYRRAGDALRRAVWDPMRSAIAGAAHVYIVTDGVLHLVNFAALPQGDPESPHDGYLADANVRVHSLASERDLVRVAAETPGRGLLAMGGADFDGAGAGAASIESSMLPGVADDGIGTLALRGPTAPCADLAALHFVPLPGSAREVHDIARLWGQGAVVRTGMAASDVAFRAEAPGKRVLHLATHGFFLSTACSPALEGTRGIHLRQRRPTRAPAVQGSQAGMALAGANRRDAAASAGDDGILTTEEIAALDLRGVEWAVLSACNTGVGEVQMGEGVLGLRRAFQIAGARSLIMSLWPVADEPTRAWMQALYRARLLLGLGTADAVHHAHTTVLAARRARGESTHPFYWAGFVSAGDWR